MQAVNKAEVIKLTRATTKENLLLSLFLGVKQFLQEEEKVREELELFSH